MTAAPEGAGSNGPAQGLGQRALNGILWTFSSAAAKAVIQILVLMILARLLDPGAFGVVAAALLVIRLAASLSTVGVGAAIIQKPELHPQDISTAFAFFLLTGTAATIAIGLAAPALAGLFRIEPLALVLVVLAPAILLESAGELASMLLRRRLRFRQLAVAALASYVLGYGVVGVGLFRAGRLGAGRRSPRADGDQDDPAPGSRAPCQERAHQPARAVAPDPLRRRAGLLAARERLRPRDG